MSEFLFVMLVLFLPAVLMYAGTWFFLPERLPFGELFSIGLFSVVFAGGTVLLPAALGSPWWTIAVLASLSGWSFCLIGLGSHFNLEWPARVLIASCGWLPLAVWMGLLMHARAMDLQLGW
jgi:hypothetical protein